MSFGGFETFDRSFVFFGLVGSNGRGVFLVANPVQLFERIAVLTVETVLVAAHELEMTAGIAESAESEHGAGGGAFVGHGFGLEVHFVSDAGRLNCPDAHQTPLGYGGFFNEGDFGGSFGMEFVEEGVDERGEAFAGFAFDENDVGEDAVAGVVAGGVVFTDGGNCAFGEGCVGFVGRSFLFGYWHTIKVCMRGFGLDMYVVDFIE